MGTRKATINAAGFCSVPLGGWLADTLARRNTVGRWQALAIGLAIAGLCLVPLTAARTAGAVAAILIASSVGKGLFDGCIYAAMHDVVPAPARGTAVGLMTTLGFVGGGLSPLLVAWASGRFGMAAGMASLAIAYFIAVVALLALMPVARRAMARG